MDLLPCLCHPTRLLEGGNSNWLRPVDDVLGDLGDHGSCLRRPFSSFPSMDHVRHVDSPIGGFIVGWPLLAADPVDGDDPFGVWPHLNLAFMSRLTGSSSWVPLPTADSVNSTLGLSGYEAGLRLPVHGFLCRLLIVMETNILQWAPDSSIINTGVNYSTRERRFAAWLFASLECFWSVITSIGSNGSARTGNKRVG